MKARREVVESVAARYQRSSKKEKGSILDEIVLTTGYSRWQASYLLRWWGRSVRRGDKSTAAAAASRTKKNSYWEPWPEPTTSQPAARSHGKTDNRQF